MASQKKGFSGRLSKGAGTHLASWLQASEGISVEEGRDLLEVGESAAANTPKGQRAWEGLQQAHGKKAGHSFPITDVAYSGDIIVTKDEKSMRLWRAHGDFALLRVVSCRGRNVAIHPCGQFIVTGTRGTGNHIKVWGPCGGSAFSAGKSKITTGAV